MRLSANLSRGTIAVEVSGSLLPAEDMFGFAERINPRRSFLFVSKVLGRHIPVRPHVMRRTFNLLASQIPHDVKGPVLFIGMAETAIGLGAGVHQQFVRNTTRQDAVYLCTTRYPLGTPLLCRFEEEHSHATGHLIHRPLDENIASLVASPKTLVLVDDEASTGKTFGNLFASLPADIQASVEEIVLVTLTDWSNGAARERLPKPVREVSILSGSYTWTPSETTAPLPQVPALDATVREMQYPDPTKDWARLGVINHDAVLSGEASPTGTTIVLGTGEHVWQPFLLAEKLEADGADVFYSSVTRSPISEGHVIGKKFAFSDNYGGSVPNYLYNVDPSQYAKIILCSETGVDHICPQLIAALGNPSIVSD